MSRLDLLTVFIVAVCLAALGFLVYKTIQLMNPPEMEQSSLESSYDLPEDTTAWLTDDTLSYLNDNVASYDEDKDDEQVGKTLAEEEEAGVKTPAAQPKTPTTTTQPKASTTKPATSSSGSTATTPRSTTTTTAPKTSTTSTATKPAAATTGKYSVVAGSFSQRANADSHAGRLRKLGYTSTEVVAVGAYASVVVNRYNALKDAENLVLELRGKGVEAFVKTRQ